MVHGEQGQETDKLRDQKVYYHRIGTKQAEDVLSFQMKDLPEAMVQSHVSHDGAYLLLTISRGNDGQLLVYYADLKSDANKELKGELVVKPIVSEWIASFDYVHNQGPEFFFMTNHNAPLNRVVKINVESPA